MKKLLLGIAVSLGLVFMPASAALAVDVLGPACQSAPNAAVCQDNKPGTGSDTDENPITGPNGIITKVVQILAIVIGIAAVIVLIISGLRLIVSASDSNAVATARRSILYAVMGVVVALLAQGLVTFVLSRVNV